MGEGDSSGKKFEFNIDISPKIDNVHAGVVIHNENVTVGHSGNVVNLENSNLVIGGSIGGATAEGAKRADVPEARKSRVKTEQELKQVHPDPIDFVHGGQTYDARHVLTKEQVAAYLAIKDKPLNELDGGGTILRVRVETAMVIGIEAGDIKPQAKDGKPEKKDREPSEYKLTNAELALVANRLRQAFLLSAKKEPSDAQIRAITEQEILKRGENAPAPQDAKPFSLAQIKEAYKKPEGKKFKFSEGEFNYICDALKKMGLKSANEITDELVAGITIPAEIGKDRNGEMTINLEGIRALLFPEKKEDKGPKFILTDQEFGFIVKDELKEDATITAANMEMKVQAAVNKCVIDYGKRKLLTDIKDAKIYTLADFKKALGIVENEPAQGHVLTEEEFAWIVQEMLKPGSGVSNIDQINTAFIKQLEGSMPSDKRGKDRIMAKSYSVQTFKDEVRNALDRQREQEMKKQVNLTPSKLHLVLYGMYSARVAQDRPPIPSNIASAVNEAQRIWKAPVDVKEVDQTYTYQQIFDLYKKFDPNKRELGGEVKTKGFLTEGEFQLVIARLKNVLVKTAGTVTIDDFNNVKIPDDKVEKGPKVVRRQYTLNEIKTALEGGAEKKEKGKDEFEMNDAIVAFVIKKLKQQSIDPKNLKLGDVDEVILSNAGDLKDARFSGPKLLVTLETIREKLRQAYEAKVSYQPKMRAPGELDAIGERFIFPYGAEGSIKKYDVRRLVADGPDGKREYGLFVQALSTEAGKRNEDMNNNLKELERRIKGEFKVVLVEEQD